MARHCNLCDHPSLNSINTRLINGVPDTTIAKEFGISRDSVRRHRESHLPQLMVRGDKIREISNADVLLARSEQLYNKAWELLQTAEKSGDIKTAMSGIGQASRVIELLARLLGEIKDVKTANVMAHPDTKELLQIVVSALAEYPEAKEHVLQALKQRFMSGQAKAITEPSEMN